ncbi:MAG TPA: hypothetical protein VGM98_10420 [Schlesneria sp.]|jgi:hypothetical protein
MFQFVKSSLFAASTVVAVLGTQALSPQANAEDPPSPKAAELVNPTGEHHVLNSSPVLDRRHSDSADTEARIRKSRRYYYAPYVYQPSYYYYYYPNTNPGMTTGPSMYFPDPLNSVSGYTADGFGYGF